MKLPKFVAQPWCPTCGGSIAQGIRWTRSLEPEGVVLIELDDAGNMKAMQDESTMDVKCGFCCVTVQLGRDLPLAAA